MANDELIIEPVTWDNADDIPKDATVINEGGEINMGNTQEQQPTITLQDALRQDIARLNSLTYNNDEVTKFGIPIRTVRDNLMQYVEVLDNAEREANMAKAAANPSQPVIDDATIAEVARYENEEDEQSGQSDSE